jgi:type I restriction enzyme S subunit
MKRQEVTLGQAIHVKHGWAFKGEFFESKGKYMVVTPGNFLEKGGFRERDGKERFYTDEFPKSFLMVKDDLIVAMTEQGEGLLGSAALVPYDDKYLHNQRIGLVQITNNEILDKGYLYWLLNTPAVRIQISATATGSKVKHTAPERIYKVKASIPNLLEQEKIASTLFRYDDLIQANQQRITLLEEAAQRLYDEWFVKLRFPKYEQVPVVDGVPEGWEKVKLCDIAKINSRSIKKGEFEYIRYVDISAVGERHIQSYLDVSVAEAAGRAKRKVQHGDIIWSCVRPNRRQFAMIWEPVAHLIVSTGFCTLTAIQVPFTYLYSICSDKALSDYLESVATGSAYPAVTATDFESYDVLKPTDEILKKYHNLCLPLISQAENLKIMNAKLMQARDELLPRLMSGQLDVSKLTLAKVA